MYFSFDVAPGYYIYSAFNGAQLRDTTLVSRAFVAPRGATVYIGDFVLDSNGGVGLRQDSDALRLMSAAQPGLTMAVELAGRHSFGEKPNYFNGL
jgi:hypothetical protein